MIKKAEFVMSNSQVAKCPKDRLPEYAFIGRSNVGKSSLINMLTNCKNLAKTSGRPGKTQLINHFKIDDRWFLVDLPGYGYARVSKTTKQVFQRFITDYFEQREQLVSAFVLVDIRHEPQKIDVEFMQWLGERAIPFAIIFTKADKLKPQAIERNVAAYKEALLEWWEEFPPYFVTSAQNKTGKEELTQYIEQTNQTIING
ncbi:MULTISPECIES: ribosome biogenesis GTP-binding protein YihA/YsxC [Capnocytophaga]|jgi:ribosome biogenesis GTP-binding protein ysxC|uniref:Probable GTP-binding protein EngB n=2 Tax=Capnocytophaga leadbetteri TaxID=327575 RepID=A0A250F8R1_9FLAO|nr:MULTISPECIES: ribosome biogenesis GTP-binding protein YihA/YsxC [Capnocytophaga]ATA81501.1 YihA family ribosome biogenesis GTP-binding protein [Capnocytophaga leadbetteri]KHE68726.1 ribosome biogenesis GTP-binding protein YsxC [Capnocytophaga sp. oral taxon 329 str. F0087]MBB1568558.1 YihA family ribosome biogenesis GTP-binding protein [Capnocytophaga sp.]QGS18476.1 YihA family ribosome biogenesis GTP-binding protein [Capnocytophaga sp. FDAARGOS_737]